jgi:hypothetical protein
MTHFSARKVDLSDSSDSDFTGQLENRKSELVTITNELGREEVMITKA